MILKVKHEVLYEVAKLAYAGRLEEERDRDLGKYLPFMRSVSVVPAGLTKFRKGLYPLELFTKEEAGQVIDLIESYQKKFYEMYIFGRSNV